MKVKITYLNIPHKTKQKNILFQGTKRYLESLQGTLILLIN